MLMFYNSAGVYLKFNTTFLARLKPLVLLLVIGLKRHCLSFVTNKLYFN